VIQEVAAQAGFDGGGDEAPNIAAQADDLLDETRTDERVGLTGHEADGFDLGTQAAIHEGYLEFVLVVGNGPDAAEENGSVPGRGIFDEQTIEKIHFDVGKIGRNDLGEHIHAFLDRKKGLFRVVPEDGDDEAVEKAGSAADEVEMAVGDGIEGSGVNCHDLRHVGEKLLRVSVYADEGSTKGLKPFIHLEHPTT
jgi:hypothetical protein